MKSALALKDAVVGIRSEEIIETLQSLLESRNHPGKLPLPWLFSGPCDDLLKKMHDASFSKGKGLPASGEELANWLKAPSNAKLVKDAHISIEFLPNPARSLPDRNGVTPTRLGENLSTFIKVERRDARLDDKRLSTPL